MKIKRIENTLIKVSGDFIYIKFLNKKNEMPLTKNDIKRFINFTRR
jgi:hypothetical protein